MPTNARQARFQSVGSPVQVVTRPLPEPGPGALRVRMQAAGVANADLMILRGEYPYMPRPDTVIGYDVVGRVESVGPGVSPERVGERVGALMVNLGAYGEWVDVPADVAVPIPEAADAAEAVALFLNYLTASQMLHRISEVQPGQKILVNSAAGGVGSALLEVARAHGVQATGSSSAAKHGLVTARGATAFDYQTQRYDSLGRDYDAVFDAVGGPALAPMYRRLRRGGRYVSYGFLHVTGKGKMAVLPTFLSLGLRMIWPDGRKVTFNTGLPQLVTKDPDWYRATMTCLVQQLVDGTITPAIAARIPLERAADAHKLLLGGSVSGKIVLVP